MLNLALFQPFLNVLQAQNSSFQAKYTAVVPGGQTVITQRGTDDDCSPLSDRSDSPMSLILECLFFVAHDS